MITIPIIATITVLSLSVLTYCNYDINGTENNDDDNHFNDIDNDNNITNYDNNSVAYKGNDYGGDLSYCWLTGIRESA